MIRENSRPETRRTSQMPAIVATIASGNSVAEIRKFSNETCPIAKKAATFHPVDCRKHHGHRAGINGGREPLRQDMDLKRRAPRIGGETGGARAGAPA